MAITPVYRPRIHRASYRFFQRGAGKKYGTILRLYVVSPPAETPYLPSNESLRSIIGSFPGLRFFKTERLRCHDILLIYARDKNMFTSRADAPTQAERRAFLQAIAQVACSLPDPTDGYVFTKKPLPSMLQFRWLDTETAQR